jgi:predicted glycosyltransferase
MRVWVDLATSPHVQILEPVIQRLRDRGHTILVTARNHSQTVDLARRHWPEVLVVGGGSPSSIFAKGSAILQRAEALRRFASSRRPDAAISHGSYAQIIAARLAGLPAVTMMDYEYQPANHVSFRLARRILVPRVFPRTALKRYGASPDKIIRFQGLKEELYLAGFKPDPRVLGELELDHTSVIAVLRPPPEGALYHRKGNPRFERLLQRASAGDVQIVLLPRTREQFKRYQAISKRIRVPERAIDALSLLALADLTIGAGGTMNRESAILGTPTYTVFSGRLAAVDAELIRSGRLIDLRTDDDYPRLEKKSAALRVTPLDAEPALAVIVEAIEAAV